MRKLKMKMKAARIFHNKVHEIKSREFKVSEIDSDRNFNISKVSKLQHDSYQRQHTQSYRAYYGVSKDKQMVTNEIYCSHVFDQILVISTNQHATTSRNTN